MSNKNNLEDRVLDGPNVGYCSSSDEDEPKTVVIDSDSDSIPARHPGTGRQTGPKGVLDDYKNHQKQARMEQKDNDQWIKEEAMKMTVGPIQPEVGDEDELERIRHLRLQNLKQSSHGKVAELTTKDDFLKVSDVAPQDSLVLIHIYREGVESCDYLNEVLKICSAKSSNVQYYKVETNILGTSKNFALNAVPTLQVYIGGKLRGNFLKINEEFGEEYDANDLFDFLSGKGIAISFENE